jgi:O-antigen ligase
MFIYSGVLMSFCVLLFGGSYHDDEGTLTRHARYSYGLIGPQIEVNHLATYMASVIPFIFYKFIKRKKAFDLFLFIVILWGTYKTGSRAALLSSVFSIIIIILSLINASRIKYVYYIVFVLLLIISFSVMPSNVKNRYFNINSYQDGSNASRLLYWAHALNLFSRSPIIGYGPVNTGLINMRITGLSHVAHNSYLSVLVQYGIIGFLVFFSIPLTIFIKALKHKNTLIVAAFVNIGFSCLIIETELNMALWIILIISVMMLQIKVSAENFIW